MRTTRVLAALLAVTAAMVLASWLVGWAGNHGFLRLCDPTPGDSSWDHLEECR